MGILVNNAGILIAKPLLETSLQEARQLIDTDLIGVVRLMQLIGRGMVERRRGVIVCIGSQTAFAGGENRAVYAAANGCAFRAGSTTNIPHEKFDLTTEP